MVDAETEFGRELEVGEHTYRALSILVQVEGTLGALRAFVGNSEGGALQATRLEEVRITRAKPLTGANPGSSPREPASAEPERSLTATLNFSTYGRQDSD